ncbi:unnamed protein product [Effrenium voratum]|nr:unnamed protein product [Effrenium voratum]CAJ1430759.1 unnamed protein product [Effrenium voratum]|mmetsp:Transcript_136038/g.322364  ORF Transcript_136038/g.322364 Transcript_136038/m.322364 type:complete len:678 (+) Transcript_136038:50-2083(+)
MQLGRSTFAQTMFRLVLLCLFQTSLAAKINAAPNLQQDSIVNLMASQPNGAKAKASEMEAMVMLLAQQAKVAKNGKADGNVTEFAAMIKEELKKLQEEVLKAAAIADAACLAAKDNLTAGCPLYGSNTTFLPSGFNGDFKELREAHQSCRAAIASKKQEMETCKTSRSSLILQEQTLTTQFQGINIFESPDECRVKGDDVLAYLASMRDHFKGKKTTWWSTYYKLENVTEDITKWNCTEKEIAYYDKIAECQNRQLSLEETACQLHERTNESCDLLPACYKANWLNYETEAARANSSIEDLRYEYRAVKRILCLLDAITSSDVQAKLEICMETKYSGAAVSSACVESFDATEKPEFTTPEVCKEGVKTILHPNDANFNETEYASKGIAASPCLASCCNLDLFHWSTYGNTYVTSDHYMVDLESGSVTDFGSMEDAKAACETMGTVLCFGVYDTACDGATEESPVKLIKAPGLDLNSVKESSIGSCVERMNGGPGTTVTTTTAQLCTYEVEISKSEDPKAVWKNLTVEKQSWGEVFRFQGCDKSELAAASTCVSAGVSNGVRLLKNRHGQAVGTGSCCGSETNQVLKSTPVKCDGYVDSYTTYENQYLTASKLIRGTAYKSMAAAREACLQKGHKCWGIFDDKCDGVNLMLADGDLNITTSMFRDSKQKSCIYQKKAA